MLHSTKKWVRQNLIKNDMHPLFVKHEFSYSKNDLIAGMISCDNSFNMSFTTKDNRHWLMFSIKRINQQNKPSLCNDQYIMIIHDADDLFSYKTFSDLITAREWLYKYFKQSISLNQINESYQNF